MNAWKDSSQVDEVEGYLTFEKVGRGGRATEVPKVEST